MEIPKLGIREKQHMGVSENRGTPQIIHLNRGFHYKPSILGYHYSWKHPHQSNYSPFFFSVSVGFCHNGVNPDRLDILSTELLALHLANNELQWLPNKLPQALQVLDLRSLVCSQKTHL